MTMNTVSYCEDANHTRFGSLFMHSFMLQIAFLRPIHVRVGATTKKVNEMEKREANAALASNRTNVDRRLSLLCHVVRTLRFAHTHTHTPTHFSPK